MRQKAPKSQPPVLRNPVVITRLRIDPNEFDRFEFSGLFTAFGKHYWHGRTVDGHYFSFEVTRFVALHITWLQRSKKLEGGRKSEVRRLIGNLLLVFGY